MLSLFLDPVYCVALREEGDQLFLSTGGGDDLGTMFTTALSSLPLSKHGESDGIRVNEIQIRLEGHSDSVTAVCLSFGA